MRDLLETSFGRAERIMSSAALCDHLTSKRGAAKTAHRATERLHFGKISGTKADPPHAAWSPDSALGFMNVRATL